MDYNGELTTGRTPFGLKPTYLEGEYIFSVSNKVLELMPIGCLSPPAKYFMDLSSQKKVISDKQLGAERKFKSHVIN